LGGKKRKKRSRKDQKTNTETKTEAKSIYTTNIWSKTAITPRIVKKKSISIQNLYESQEKNNRESQTEIINIY